MVMVMATSCCPPVVDLLVIDEVHMLASTVCVCAAVVPADPDSRRPDLSVTWVHKASSRIWRGSYANNDWQVRQGEDYELRALLKPAPRNSQWLLAAEPGNVGTADAF